MNISDSSAADAGSAARLDHPSVSLEREADLHELAAERFLALGDDVRAERERATATRLRDVAAHRRS